MSAVPARHVPPPDVPPSEVAPSGADTAVPAVVPSPHPDTAPESCAARALAALEAARARTLGLVDCLDEAGLTAQHSPLMSPLAWDLAHIGNQEDLWLLRRAGGRPGVRPDLDPVYDAFLTPRADRPGLPMLPPAEARRYVAEVRAQALEVLEKAPSDAERLTRSAFVFGMIAQHEQQHDETMLATHQLRRGPAVLHAPPPPGVPDGTSLPPEVLVPGGPFTMGTDDDPWALDNERSAHRVDVPAFWLDTTPVTAGAYAVFIDDGGYDEPRWWHPDGWAHVRRTGLRAPLFWRREADGWTRRRFGRVEPVPLDSPVLHVSWYEADAYARWAGRRLPTEAEWEKAARHDPATGRSRRHPWGETDPGPEHANLGQRHLEPAPAGAYPLGEAPCGARQLLGDVWEWTASDFAPYPGFEAYPYREYSEVFFPTGSAGAGAGGSPDYKVLRGGSFGTAHVACRTTFRNWDHPVRRQIFAGFRTARAADTTAATAPATAARRPEGA
ncbi:ergothioneine biosynthesis protein EgtB [Streptomyces chumphonensis]|uniref:Hercynine oxygenase n=1 Tax=Streptomyces chumphonensis TaxID=1214925 RepID=A0A927EY57_9ACTN|nr:ergothioneine biosynthesis protein EgtB [Streptomyces chumphonensis]MBD3932140.1 ergothioneine biosynthesis protein EgtB [Streptomyces chumphonensis]